MILPGSAAQIRLLFLLHKYNTPMDYGDDGMSGALGAEKTFNEFFHNIKAALRRSTTKVIVSCLGPLQLMNVFCISLELIRDMLSEKAGRV